MMTTRLAEFLEKNNIFSDSQGGFRKNKTTWNKIWSLRNVIEHAKMTKSPLHITYIDLAKAYDSVEHWALEKTLRYMGFNPNFIEIIKEMCAGNLLKIITAYGLTDEFKVK